MNDSFISRKDRIIASAIEIISEFGLSALTTRNLALKENMSEALIYKYFGGIDDVLVEVVEYYSKFDNGIRQTVTSKNEKYIYKVRDYLEAYVTYYDNYYAISTIMLQYEELLHNTNTRDKISWCIVERTKFVEDLFAKAIKNKEIIDTFTPSELTNTLFGVLRNHTLTRRIIYTKKSYKKEVMDNIRKWIDLITISE